MVKRKFTTEAKNTSKLPNCWQEDESSTMITDVTTGPTKSVPLDDDVEQEEDSLLSVYDQSLPSASCSSSSSSTTSSDDTSQSSQEPPPAPYFDGYYATDPNRNLPEVNGLPQEEFAGEIPLKILFPPAQNECGFIPSDSLCLAVELLNMCMHAKVPLDFYERVLRLFKNHALRHVEDDHNITWRSIPTTREDLLKLLKTQIPCVQPTSYTITSTQDIVPEFPFLDQLINLFSTPFFQDIGA